ncbi:MAG: HAMP domain-containing sensor histidine kinase, partial [Candidatus Micrarchaeota archaeon]
RRKLEQQNKELREKNDIEAAFVSNVSHEIRTPLTNIHGYSLLMQEDSGKMDSDHKKYIDIITSETDRLRKLINNVLDISRLDSMRFKLDQRETDLASLREKCSCTYLAENKGLYVNWEFEEDLPNIYADPIRLSQVLINLISNSIKFTEAGGVTVRAFRKGRNHVQVDVKDTGEGIPESEVSSLFKRFYQTSGGKKRGGTGLGLAITRQIVELHGGKIWVSSKVGEGSTFSFTIPTKKKQPRLRKKKQVLPRVEPLQSQKPATQNTGDSPIASIIGAEVVTTQDPTTYSS